MLTCIMSQLIPKVGFIQMPVTASLLPSPNAGPSPQTGGQRACALQTWCLFSGMQGSLSGRCLQRNCAWDHSCPSSGCPDVTAGPWDVPVWWQKDKCHTIGLLSPSSLVYVLHARFKCSAPWLGCRVHHKTWGSRLQPSSAPGLTGDRPGGTSVKTHIFVSDATREPGA